MKKNILLITFCISFYGLIAHSQEEQQRPSDEDIKKALESVKITAPVEREDKDITLFSPVLKLENHGKTYVQFFNNETKSDYFVGCFG